MESYYYKQIDESGGVIRLVSYNGIVPNITDPSYVQITAEEFETLLLEFKAEAETDASENATEADYLEALSELGVAVE